MIPAKLIVSCPKIPLADPVPYVIDHAVPFCLQVELKDELYLFLLSHALALVANAGFGFSFFILAALRKLAHLKT